MRRRGRSPGGGDDGGAEEERRDVAPHAVCPADRKNGLVVSLFGRFRESEQAQGLTDNVTLIDDNENKSVPIALIFSKIIL